MLRIVPFLLLSIFLNLYQWNLSGGLKETIKELQKVETATEAAFSYKCAEDAKTAEVVTRTIKEIKYVEIPEKVERSAPLPPDLKRLLDEAYEDLFPDK